MAGTVSVRGIAQGWTRKPRGGDKMQAAVYHGRGDVRVEDRHGPRCGPEP